jgi:hypothetical protein
MENLLEIAIDLLMVLNKLYGYLYMFLFYTFDFEIFGQEISFNILTSLGGSGALLYLAYRFVK